MPSHSPPDTELSGRFTAIAYPHPTPREMKADLHGFETSMTRPKPTPTGPAKLFAAIGCIFLRPWVALLLIVGLMSSCAQAQTEPMPDRYNFEAKPMLPVRLWTEWIQAPTENVKAPGLQAGNIFEATIDLIQIEGVWPRKTLFFFLRPDFNDDIFVRIQLPAPIETWVPFERGDRVIVQVIDAPTQGKKKPKINVSIVRTTDGSALHVLEGQSTLPEPFPEALSLVPRMSRIGQVAEGDRRFCAQVFERHPMEMRRDGYEPIRLLPGHPLEFDLGRDVEGWVEVRDCLSSTAGTCPNSVDGQWHCQALVALRPSDEPTPPEEMGQ